MSTDILNNLDNNIYKSLYPMFKPPEAYNSDFINITSQNKNSDKNKRNSYIKSFSGAGLGVVLALISTKALAHKKDGVLYKFMDLFHFKAGEGKGQETFIDVFEMITTAACANAGAVALNSFKKTKEQKKAKWKEAGFQIMNMAIPMLMVTAAIKTCENVKPLNKTPLKIVSSISAMMTGAFCATQITNLGKEKENRRKYTPKDSLANFDDVIATIKLGFKEITKIVPVDKILPFIYIYSGARAGMKGDIQEQS